jgi:hypothetical protein
MLHREDVLVFREHQLVIRLFFNVHQLLVTINQTRLNPEQLVWRVGYVRQVYISFVGFCPVLVSSVSDVASNYVRNDIFD